MSKFKNEFPLVKCSMCDEVQLKCHSECIVCGDDGVLFDYEEREYPDIVGNSLNELIKRWVAVDDFELLYIGNDDPIEEFKSLVINYNDDNWMYSKHVIPDIRTYVKKLSDNYKQFNKEMQGSGYGETEDFKIFDALLSIKSDDSFLLYCYSLADDLQFDV